MPRGVPTKVLAVRVPEPELALLKAEARRRRIRLSQYVRRVFSEELDRLVPIVDKRPSGAVLVGRPDGAVPAPVVRGDLDVLTETGVWNGRKVARNAYCPCGSGKKFKRCHSKEAVALTAV